MNWRGHALENLCLYHISEIQKALGISGIEVNAFPWVSARKQGGAQIDLVLERADQITNICEVKYTDSPYRITAEYEHALLNKLYVFKEESKTKQALRIVLITAEGLAEVAYSERIAKIITLDDLFDA